mmetsp:Transcript_17698/g.42940  ORF Transcript_17698/g.42940 Transcript_17698/m.42940 type:complete len:125 (-) Transcript_17698:72-446(-)
MKAFFLSPRDTDVVRIKEGSPGQSSPVAGSMPHPGGSVSLILNLGFSPSGRSGALLPRSMEGARPERPIPSPVPGRNAEAECTAANMTRRTIVIFNILRRGGDFVLLRSCVVVWVFGVEFWCGV